jgi:hypothetical protein
MFHGSSGNALALANSAILAELLKGMDGGKRNALLERAAESLETGPHSRSAVVIEAAKLLRNEWTKVAAR